jgi:hypothetical protein
LVGKGDEAVNIAGFGSGIHNNEYSIMLIDGLFGIFEDVIDRLVRR